MNGTPDNWSTLVDMGNFSSNQDDMIKIEIDYITPVLMASKAATPVNYFDSVEVMLDYIPQQYSYDNSTMTNTVHLAFLEKNVGQMQSKPFTGPDITMSSDPSADEELKVWNFSQSNRLAPWLSGQKCCKQDVEHTVEIRLTRRTVYGSEQLRHGKQRVPKLRRRC